MAIMIIFQEKRVLDESDITSVRRVSPSRHSNREGQIPTAAKQQAIVGIVCVVVPKLSPGCTVADRNRLARPTT